MALFGFGDSDKRSTTNVSNQQVATQSGIATGGTGNTSNISISNTSADPDVARAAITGNAVIADTALSKGFDFGETIQGQSLSAIQSTVGLALAGNDTLTGKFVQSVSDTQARETALLQNVADNANQQVTAERSVARDALDQSFTNAARSTAQTPGYVTENVIGTASKLFYAVVAVIGLGIIVYAFKRK